MRRLGKPLFALGAVALLVTALSAAPGAGASPGAHASACTAASDIEAIIDDSGSMAVTDKNRLRVQALNLLIDTLDPSTQLGAVEFGGTFSGLPGAPPSADTVFPFEPVGPNASTMRSALDAAIHADNPGADARIFLTDGGHDVGTYSEAHLVHKVPTYVIGFGFGISSPADKQRLQKIAKDTGGQYFSLKDSSQLQAVMNKIEAALTCQTPPQQFTDLLKQGQSKLHSVSIGAATKSIQITLTWASPLDKFKLSGLRLVGNHGVIAVASRKPAKLQVTTEPSATFTIVQVSNLRKGTLRFSVKGAKVASGAKATLTTQVGQSSNN